MGTVQLFTKKNSDSYFQQRGEKMAITDRISLAKLPNLATLANTAMKVKNEIQSRIKSALATPQTQNNETTVVREQREQEVRTVHAEPMDVTPVMTAVKKPRRAAPKKVAKKDAAHAPGHRKLDMKAEKLDNNGTKVITQKSAQNRMAGDNRIGRTQSPMRRTVARTSGGARKTHSGKSVQH
jgi:hypothetical protein